MGQDLILLDPMKKVTSEGTPAKRRSSVGRAAAFFALSPAPSAYRCGPPECGLPAPNGDARRATFASFSFPLLWRDPGQKGKKSILCQIRRPGQAGHHEGNAQCSKKWLREHLERSGARLSGRPKRLSARDTGGYANVAPVCSSTVPLQDIAEWRSGKSRKST